MTFTLKNHAEWCKEQAEWCKGQVDWYSKQIECETNTINRCKKEDREAAEFVFSKGPVTKLEMEIYGGKYVGRDTKKAINTRRKYYLKRKKYTNDMARYIKESHKYAELANRYE